MKQKQSGNIRRKPKNPEPPFHPFPLIPIASYRCVGLGKRWGVIQVRGRPEHGERVAERGVVVVVRDGDTGTRSVISCTYHKELILSVPTYRSGGSATTYMRDKTKLTSFDKEIESWWKLGVDCVRVREVHTQWLSASSMHLGLMSYPILSHFELRRILSMAPIIRSHPQVLVPDTHMGVRVILVTLESELECTLKDEVLR